MKQIKQALGAKSKNDLYLAAALAIASFLFVFAWHYPPAWFAVAGLAAIFFGIPLAGIPVVGGALFAFLISPGMPMG